MNNVNMAIATALKCSNGAVLGFSQIAFHAKYRQTCNLPLFTTASFSAFISVLQTAMLALSLSPFRKLDEIHDAFEIFRTRQLTLTSISSEWNSTEGFIFEYPC